MGVTGCRSQWSACGWTRLIKEVMYVGIDNEGVGMMTWQTSLLVSTVAAYNLQESSGSFLLTGKL